MHLMIDLETLSTDPRAVVLSIGAVVFDKNHTYREFYRELEVDPQIRAGRHVSASTIGWWVDQGDDAKRVFGDNNKVSLARALEDFSTWLGSDAREVKVWSNGADFDLPVLVTAFNDAQLPVPWMYRNTRCFRTIRALYEARVPQRTHAGVAHNAVDDARRQAFHLQDILQCASL